MSALTVFNKTVNDVAKLTDWRDVMKAHTEAEAWRLVAKRIKDPTLMENTVRVIWEAKRKAGELLVLMEEKGERASGKVPKGSKIGSRGTTLAELGIKPKESFNFQNLYRLPQRQFEALVAQKIRYHVAMSDSEGAAIKEIRKDKRKVKTKRRAQREKDMARVIRPLSGTNRFGVILVNPPWKRTAWSAAGHDRHDEATWATDIATQDDELKSLPVDTIAYEEGCLLVLWCPEAWRGAEVARAWGFQPVSEINWLKDIVSERQGDMLHVGDTLTVKGVAGPGYWARSRAEKVIIATKGKPLSVSMGEQTENVWFAPRCRGHEKPDVAREWIERHWPNIAKVELFAHQYRDGWASWGPDLPDGPRGFATDETANATLLGVTPPEAEPDDDSVEIIPPERHRIPIKDLPLPRMPPLKAVPRDDDAPDTPRRRQPDPNRKRA